jgi:hypothetical protein
MAAENSGTCEETTTLLHYSTVILERLSILIVIETNFIGVY